MVSNKTLLAYSNLSPGVSIRHGINDFGIPFNPVCVSFKSRPQKSLKTIYINENETSHFSPLRDSIRIYSLILKYLVSSLSAFLVDIIAFSFFLSAARGLFIHNYIIISTYLSKIISCTYTYVVNKNLVVKRKNGNKWTIAKYTALCIGQATASGFLTYTLVNVMNLNEVISKIIADIFLFFVSFRIQDRWVFRQSRKNV